MFKLRIARPFVTVCLLQLRGNDYVLSLTSKVFSSWIAVSTPSNHIPLQSLSLKSADRTRPGGGCAVAD